MTYAEDRAAEQNWVLSRAHQLDPVAWVSYSGKPKPVKQRVERARDAALRQARLEYDGLRESGVAVKPPKNGVGAMIHRYIRSEDASTRFYLRFEKPLEKSSPTGRRPARYYMPVFTGAELAARCDEEALPPAFGIEVDFSALEARVWDWAVEPPMLCNPSTNCRICYPGRVYDFSPNSPAVIA